MKRVLKTLMIVLLVIATPATAGDKANPTCDGTPQYDKTVMQSYRLLQFKTSVYEKAPKLGKGIRLGIYQAQAVSGEGATAKNLKRMEHAIRLAKEKHIQLLSFPELYIPGYTLSPAMVKKVAQFKDGPAVTKARELARRNNIAILLPYAEKAKHSDGTLAYYDSIAVIDEHGKLLNSYRKTHLYGQQERDNWSFGNGDYQVYHFFGFPVGVLNCYECEFPELSRILALKGAKLIVGPTAADNYYTLPDGKRSNVPYPDISKTLIPAYAYANNIFFAYSNRAGYERRGKDQWHYRGNSIITGPHGDIIVAANHEQDTMLIADCIPGFYGMTHPAPKYNYLRDRRPELYKELTAPKVDFIKGGYTYPVYRNGKEIFRKR
ncbi:carbon-nitrogen hydrolase family protein [Sulfurovum sp. NBC37-1]|uniref:carbon-nitrogen hydrolase family protein n=1 Tax=Sulfurovum sp. (strain NBC37-1) TaxID=387093 RepID=UPI00015875B5|nr:carbon-nitrogen hydrolase family protein [Sulfurovum sp. NBC37-1]BAF71834.1 carbon-nitrogen hydrolase family protein [Sulfurovum sp. NBC37-1]